MIFFFSQNNYKLQKKNIILNWIKYIIKKENYKINFINIIFCNDLYLETINNNFLNHYNEYTDVITFNYSNNNVLTGEIYLSTERVYDNSIIFKVLFIHELYRVIIHGILHLCGYTDDTSINKKIMTCKENNYLSLLKFK